MKHFSKVLSSTQTHSPRTAGYVEKLELPNNPKDSQIEPARVFRLFELFDRGECVSGDQDKGGTLPSLAWCLALCSLSNAPSDDYTTAARQQSGCGGAKCLQTLPKGPVS